MTISSTNELEEIECTGFKKAFEHLGKETEQVIHKKGEQKRGITPIGPNITI